MVELASLPGMRDYRVIRHNYGEVRRVQYSHLFEVGDQVMAVRRAFSDSSIDPYPFGCKLICPCSKLVARPLSYVFRSRLGSLSRIPIGASRAVHHNDIQRLT